MATSFPTSEGKLCLWSQRVAKISRRMATSFPRSEGKLCLWSQRVVKISRHWWQLRSCWLEKLSGVIL
ncbi:hypothetical protein CGRA01v4_05895 [Colletotrichum graminicola]|nr:hypothetical protein CGRA01v4_05895 [Colletotrichum graminicola]